MATVLNHDIVGLHARMNRFITEMYKSVSSTNSGYNSFDMARSLDYLNAIDQYHAWVVAQPQLDLPETHPRKYELETNAVVEDVENESVNDLIRLMVLTRDELTNSQSARNAAGLIGFDSIRLSATVSKARHFLTDYVQIIQPLDFPESSPQSAVSGPGRQGI